MIFLWLLKKEGIHNCALWVGSLLIVLSAYSQLILQLCHKWIETGRWKILFFFSQHWRKNLANQESVKQKCPVLSHQHLSGTKSQLLQGIPNITLLMHSGINSKNNVHCLILLRNSIATAYLSCWKMDELREKIELDTLKLLEASLFFPIEKSIDLVHDWYNV